MNCEDVRTLLDGYADGELDLVNHLQIEQHVVECEDCSQRVKKTAGLSKALSDDSFYYRAPNELREKIRISLGPPEREAAMERWWNWRWLPALATAAVATAVLMTMLVFLLPTRSADDMLASEIVSAHVRSMMIDNHLTDVPSSDQHTVKPWFDGKLDFAPPVIDLDGQGFKLIGGRLDYAAGRSVAALVYQRRQHKINLFIFPSDSNSNTPNKILLKQGYSVIHWDRSGMTFWAISDLNLNELQEFAQDLQS